MFLCAQREDDSSSAPRPFSRAQQVRKKLRHGLESGLRAVMKTSQIARQRWSRDKRGKNRGQARAAVGRDPPIEVIWHGCCWVIADASHDAPAPAPGRGEARE